MKTREPDNRKPFRISNHVLEEENSENSNDLFHIYKNSSKISKSVIVKVNRNNVKTIRTQEQAVIPVDYESQSFKLLYILLKRDKPDL